MSRRVLVADDDASVRRIVSRALGAEGEPYDVIAASDGSQVLDLAAAGPLDLILLDIEMPVKDGWAVLKELRSAARTRTTPIIMVTGHAELSNRVGGLEMGADDILAKPFAIEELKARVNRLLRRVRQDLAANPLTLLPGSPAIEEEVARRLKEGRPFAFFHADIDRFKSYNDRYGFARGDTVIRETAKILEDAVRPDPEGFLGHIGGDDFALIAGASEAACVAQRAAQAFDLTVPDLYDAEDFARGFIEATDRLGHRRRFPVIRLSMGIVSNERRCFEHYGQIVEVASEMKRYLKAGADRGLSRFAFDRRSGD